jgi:hypothetical protein
MGNMETVESSTRSPVEPNFVDDIVILNFCKSRGRGGMMKKKGSS